jgi:hypothetical protein
MLRELRTAAAAVIAMAASFSAPPQIAAQTQAPPSLQEQLEAQYQRAKMTNANGCTITAPGTALRVQKPGVFAVPGASLVFCQSKYEDGKVNGPGVVCKAMVGQNAGTFQAGDTVYPLKIEVNAKKERIVFGFASCDQGAAWKGEVAFQFPKDYLEKASVTEVEDKISELLALAGNDAQQTQSSPASPDQAPGGGPAPAAPTVAIQIGQTVQEVEAVLGQPEKKVDLGVKQIYIYKDLKITFLGGKVSDVQ